MSAWRRRNEVWNNKRKKSGKEIRTGIACKETAGTVNAFIEGSGCNCNLKELVDNIIQERMQSAFSKMKSGKESDTEDNVEKKYEEAVTSLSEDKKQAVRGCCDAIFDSRTESEIFLYRLGFQDAIWLNKIVKR